MLDDSHYYFNKTSDVLGLSDRVRFRLLDYRELTEQYDRIVSIGMFEHVGVHHYPEFFEKIFYTLG